MNEIKTKEMICINCPLGCHLKVHHLGENAWKVEGMSCVKGKNYGIQEFIAPKRMVTTTVRIQNSHWPRLPVRTAAPIPKEKVQEIAQILHQITVQAPVQMGEVILANVLDTQVDVIASRSMSKI